MRVGDVVGERFTIEALAGHGGMGVVYRARDATLGRPAAVKVLLDRSPGAAQRFGREAALLAGVDHPGVVTYLAHDTSGAEAWLATEWIEGDTLEERISGAGLTAEEAVHAARGAADALSAVHAKGVVHRDVKPSNLMLVGGDASRIKLLDFGIARGEHGAITSTGAVIGSPFYMSPEQARGERDLDARADVFSLGCVLFRALTGKPPFDAPTAPAVLLRIVLDEAPSLAEARADLRPELVALVARMLAKERGERPRDCVEVASLLAAIGSQGPASGPASEGARALTTAERRVASLVLARPRAGDETTADGTKILAGGDADLRAALATHGGALDILADGTLVVVPAGGGHAVDRAERAARCALAIRALGRVDAVAVAFGEHEVTGRAAVGALIDVGLGLLDAPTAYVRVDPRLARLLEARFDLGKDAGGVVLRGDRDAGSPAAPTVLGRALPCVGRDAELGVLQAMIAHAFDESAAGAALIVAPAGIGKSRVARELLARIAVRPEPATVWSARGDALTAGAAFGLLGPLLRAQAAIGERDAPEVAEAKLRARVGRHLPSVDVARVTEFLGALASIPLSSQPSTELSAARDDPRRLAEGMRRAFADLVRAEASVRPLVIVLEDLHHGDLPTVKAIDAMLGELVAAPIFVLALGRSETTEIFPRLWETRGLQTIALRELGRRASESLARAALGPGASPEAIARVVARAAGNAFFLEELVRAEAAGFGAALPETVLASVGARLGALEPGARRVLRAASVFGDTFWRGGILPLLGGEGAKSSETDAWLRELEDREIVAPRRESRLEGEIELGFRHALVRESAYAMLTDDDRALGHRLAGAWLESHGERDHALLAAHFERGQDLDRAAVHQVHAARSALGAEDFRTALSRARRAVVCGASGELLGEARLVELEANRYDGDHDDSSVRAADEAVALLAPGSASYYRAVGLQSSTYFNAAKTYDPEDSYRLTLVPPLPAAGAAQRRAIARLSHQFVFNGRSDLIEASLAALGSDGDEQLDGEARGLRSRALGLAARAKQEIEPELWHFGTALRFYTETGFAAGVMIVHTDLAMLHADVGLFEEALRHGKEALAAGTKAKLGFFVAGGKTCIARALAGLGRLDEARALFGEALALASSQRNASIVVGWAKMHQGQLQLELGDREGAARTAAEAGELLAQVKIALAGPHAVRARAFLGLGRVDDALAAARAAERCLAGGSFFAPLARLALAETLFASGRVDEAKIVLAEARARLQKAAGEIRDPRMRDAFLNRAPEHARTIALAAAWIGE